MRTGRHRWPLHAALPVVACTAALLTVGGPREAAAQDDAVDIELILAVDVSLSMSPRELGIQREGYVAALTHEAVINAIREGIHGRIAIAYFEWAGDTTHYLVVPWTIIAGREDAERVASMLTDAPPASARRTSISGAMLYAADLFAESPYRGLKRVIDISGDGPNNQGPFVDATRDRIVAQGISINGLPLMTDGGLTSAFDITDLDRYYADCVIGGPGAFVVPVNDWSQFPEAVRRKLVLELVGTPGGDPAAGERFPLVKAAVSGSYDCQVGEKRWQNRTWIFRDP